MLHVRIVNKSKHPLPSYSTGLSAGMDLRADLDNPVELKSLERKLIPTGLFIELPVGFEAQIRPRSGLAIKKGLTVLNTPGTIDADYRGEIGVALINFGNVSFTVRDGDRIAQMVISPVFRAILEEVDELPSTERQGGGFGHTGL